MGYIVLAIGLVIGVLACGDDDEQSATQPAPDVTTFEQGRFDDVPLHPRSEPVGPRSEKDGVVTRSYEVRGASPKQILEFYEGDLDDLGWTNTEAVQPVGTATYQGEWANDEWELRISANEAPGLGDDNPTATAVISQYSLVLSPLP